MTFLHLDPTVYIPGAARVLVVALVGAAAGAQSPSPGESPRHVFPTITAENLSGREMTLPRDFAGRANLVFVAFEREQQATVDTWLPHATALAAARPGFRFYEIPTIKRRYAVMGAIINGGMRGGVTDPAARDATITLFTNVDDFRDSLGLGGTETIYALLLDESGTVRWRGAGAFDPAQGESLRSAIDALLASAQR